MYMYQLCVAVPFHCMLELCLIDMHQLCVAVRFHCVLVLCLMYVYQPWVARPLRARALLDVHA